MKNPEFDIDSANDALLDLVREYQAEGDQNKKCRIIEKILSRFDWYIRKQRYFLGADEFKQFILISFWKADYLGKYDFVSKSIVGYIMSHIYYCRLRAYNAEKANKNELNRKALSLYGGGRASDDNEKALIDILYDRNENPEAAVNSIIESERRLELLKSFMPRFGENAQNMIRAILDNPECGLSDLAEHCKCSAERARQVLSKLMMMVRSYERQNRR